MKNPKYFIPVLIVLLVILSGQLFAQSGAFKTKKWKFETKGKVFTSPLVQNGTIYFGSSDSSFYAVNAKSGQLEWQFKTGGAVNSDAFIDEDRVYFGSMDGYYYAVNRERGSQIWRFKTGGEAVYDPWDYYMSSPVVSGDLVYFGSGDNNIYAVNKMTGEEVWHFATSGIVHTRGEISNGKICFGSFDGIMYCLDLLAGKLIWKFDTVGNRYFPKGEIQGSAAVFDDVLYFGSRDYILYALNMNDGSGIWIEQTPSWVIARPVIRDSILFVGTSDSPRCYAFGAVDGGKIWEYEIMLNIFGSAIVDAGAVFYPSFDGKIYVLDRKTGGLNYTIQSDVAEKNFSNIFTKENKLKQSILDELKETGNIAKIYDLLHTLGSVLAAPVIADDVLYFTGTDGSLYAFGY